MHTRHSSRNAHTLGNVWPTLVVGLAALSLYVATAYPDVGPVDSGELTLAAWTLGVPHPPGFPLYVLLGWAWAHLLPWGNVAWRLNVFSAVAAALAVAALARFAAAVAAPAEEKPFARAWPGVAAAALLAVGSTYWRAALVAEVYALNTLIVVGILGLCLTAPQRARWAVGLGGLLGLGLGVHPVSTLFVVPFLLAWAWPGDKATRRTRGLHLLAMVGAVAALVLLILYAGLMWRAGQDPPLNWGAPDTPRRLWWHITAKQYQVNLLTASWSRRATLLGESLRLWLGEMTPVGWFLGLAGWYVLSRRQRRWGWAFAASTVVTLLYTASYDIAQDREAYHLPLFAATALGVAPALAWGARRSRARGRALLALGLVVLALAVGVWRGRTLNRGWDTIPADYVYNALGTVAPDALVLTTDWQLYSPTLYKQGVEGFRPDVLVIDLWLWQNRPWYVEAIMRRYPDLAARWQPALGAFLDELWRFEAGTLEDTGRIAAAYRELLTRMATASGRPVYLDVNALAHYQEQGATWGGVEVPEGLFFRVYREAPPTTLPPLDWRLDALRDPRARLDPVEAGIRQYHAVMLFNRARYLEWVGDVNGAAAAAALAETLR